MTLPELLAPAGNLEKLKIAFRFGADAVFVGGKVFGLRKYADNFDLTELKAGVDLANQLGKQVYVVLNGFAHEADMDALHDHLAELEAIQPHGFIISDMGVFQLAKRLTTIPLHVSTQASVTNAAACQFWKEAGASRIILAREVSVAECREILAEVETELEVFVHGAMCASYSGKCVISNYSAGRDSNRGGCVQSCRHPYHVADDHGPDAAYTRHIMNAKDLNALMLLPEIVQSGIASLKIEGRMKSNLYLANAVRAYRLALDAIAAGLEGDALQDYLTTLSTDLSLVSNRQFTTGGVDHPLDADSVNRDFGHYEKSIELVGTVKETSDQWIWVDLKGGLTLSDALGVLGETGHHPLPFDEIRSYAGRVLPHGNPNSVIQLAKTFECQPLDILYKQVSHAH